jgi:probable rRNA maturation factor
MQRSQVSPSRTQPTELNPSEDEGALVDGVDEGIAVQVDEEFADRVDANDVIAAVRATLEAEGRPGEVTVVITTDEAVAELNELYRQTEGPTDVLSFPAQDPTPGFVSAPEMAGYLGDIIIALPFTERQAADLGRPLSVELRLLAVHGSLHLLGYDHAEPDEEAAMWARQDAILARLP